VQHDWHMDLQNALKNGGGKSTFWFSFHKSGQSTHGHINADISPQGITLDCGDTNFKTQFKPEINKCIKLISGENTEYVFQSPSSSASPLKKMSNCINISPGGELGVCGGNDGALGVFETSDFGIRREFAGHVGDILTCRFFPSGQVILSGGSDLQLKIWSVTEGFCAATCKGHSGGILGTSIVDKGKNIISCSRDGTARLWECASQACLAVLTQEDKAINHCFLCTSPSVSTSNRQLDPREVGTDGKLLLLACENGSLIGVDLISQKEAFRVNCGSAVNSCMALNDTTYLAGTQDGIVYEFSASKLNSPMQAIHYSNAAITSLDFGNSSTEFCAGTADGLCYYWDTQYQKCTKFFTGPDVEPITSLSTNRGTVYTSSRDGFIRKYTK